MLDKLRAAVNSWPARILLGLVLLSFVAWGGHSAFQASDDDTLLIAGDASVSASVYDITLRNQLLRLSMGLGRYLTPDEIARYGINQAVFAGLYRNILLDNSAVNMKIGASDKTVADLLSRDRLFADADGNFDINAFNFYLQNLRISRDDFLADFYVKAAKRNQIIATVEDSADMPDAFYRALALYSGQTRNIVYAELTANALGSQETPDAQALEAWFKTNGGQFRTPEYRQITYIELTPQIIASPDKIDAKAVAAYYDAHKDRYIETPQRRSFELIRFADRKSADAAYAAFQAEVKAGQSEEQAFGAAFARQPLGRREQRRNAAQADLPALLGAEIFALKQGGISAIINDLQGPAWLRVSAIEAEKPKPLVEAAAQIRRDIAQEQAAAALPDYRKKIEDLRFDGANLKEIAAQYNLPLHKLELDKDGNTPQGKNADFPQASTLLPNIFQAAENVDADPLNLNKGGYIWYNIDKIIAPRQNNLAEVRPQAVAAWQRQRRQFLLDSRATALAKELNKGADFAALAKASGLTLRHLDNLRRDAGETQISGQAIAAIFAAVKGESNLSSGAHNDSRIIFRVDSINEPKNAGRDSLAQEQRDAVSARLAADYLGLYIGAQALQTPVHVNQAVYRRLLQAEGQGAE